MNMFKNRKVLVAGGTGLIGIPLVEMLIEQGAEVRIASLDDSSRAHPAAEFIRTDLTILENCLNACRGRDFVFNLLGVKGSPAVTVAKPASFFVPTILMATQLMEAARRSEVEGYLYCSSIAVYSPAEVLYEDNVWKGFPSERDKFAGWAKRMGELQAEAYKIQYGWDRIAIARPANTYGPYDNFDRENAMVIPSLIKRAVDGENPLRVWGDGTAVRDFIHAKDAARGMLLAAAKMIGKPVNLSSGTRVSIKELMNIIVSNLDTQPEIIWDTSKPEGDKFRVMDISRARSIGFQPQISLEDGIRETMEWYQKNRSQANNRYDIFV